MPVIYYSVESLKTRGVKKVLETGQVASEVASQLLEKLWQRMDDETKLQLASYGLSRFISDGMAEMRARKLREQYDDDKKQREEKARERDTEIRGRRLREAEVNKLVDKGEEPIVAKINELHDKVNEYYPCTKKTCNHPTHRNHRCKFNCVCRRLGLSDVDTWDITPQGVDDLFAKLKEEKKQAEKVERESKKVQQTFDYLHELSRCSNRTCAEGRYPGGYGHCAYKKYGWMTPEDAEKAARQWGEMEKGWEEQRYNTTKAWIDIAVNHGYKTAINDLRSITLLASDGTMKTLVDFSKDDVEAWCNKSETNAKAWVARRTWFDTAKEMLTNAQVETVCLLPPEDLSKLGSMACDIWKEQSSQLEQGE